MDVFFPVIVILLILVALVVVTWILPERNMAARAKVILSRQDEWGEETCQALIDGKVKIGMTQEMIREAFGSPTRINQIKKLRELGEQDSSTDSKPYENEQWIYSWVYDAGKMGSSAKSATNTLMFIDGKVTHIRQQLSFQNWVERYWYSERQDMLEKQWLSDKLAELREKRQQELDQESDGGK